VILRLKSYVTPCLSHVLGPSVIPSVSGVETLCDALFESCHEDLL
jgi:hypothetical protein